MATCLPARRGPLRSGGAATIAPVFGKLVVGSSDHLAAAIIIPALVGFRQLGGDPVYEAAFGSPSASRTLVVSGTTSSHRDTSGESARMTSKKFRREGGS